MSKREETPDVLGALLGSEPQDVKPSESESTKTLKRQDVKTVKKQKLTAYLAPDAMATLDGLQVTLRAMGGSRKDVTKSAIVEQAVRFVAEDLERHGAKSHLGRALVGP